MSFALLLPLLAAPLDAENWIGPPSPAPAATDATAGSDAQPNARPTMLPGPAPLGEDAPAQAPEPFGLRLLALEVAVSEVMVRDPANWRFDRLQDEAAALQRSATDERDRQSARELHERLDRFAAIAARRRRTGPSTLFASRVAPPVRRTKASVAAPAGHDAEGVLRPVVSQRPDAPKYALVDDDGELAALVSPSPGAEERLQSLVGRRVGLDGRRGYLTDLRQPHLVAERVTPLRPTSLR